MAQNESFDFDGPAGRLEALLMRPADEPVATAVICHAHPLHGGMMHFKVIFRAAKALQEAGASLMVLELVPAEVGKQVTEALDIPVMGIGAGPHCSGQILNLYDMLDIYQGRKPRFVKNFMQGADSIATAVGNYVSEVKAKTFPGPEHCF